MDEERKMQAEMFLGLKPRLYFPTLHLAYRCAPAAGWQAVLRMPMHVPMLGFNALAWGPPSSGLPQTQDCKHTCRRQRAAADTAAAAAFAGSLRVACLTTGQSRMMTSQAHQARYPTPWACSHGPWRAARQHAAASPAAQQQGWQALQQRWWAWLALAVLLLVAVLQVALGCRLCLAVAGWTGIGSAR
jgi:hypothetical protein